MRGGIVGLQRRLANRGNGIVGLRRRYGFNISLKNITFTRHDTDSDISERPAIDADEERRAGGHDEVLRKRSVIAERTLDQFDAAFDPDENPAPERLAAQLTEFRTSYNALNDAYALTRESLITQDIAALVNALNNNIDYVRKHAMAKGTASDEPQPEPGGGSDDVTPVTPEVGDMN